MTFISDDEFARLVSEDVKNKVSSRQRQTLMAAEHLDRWQRALIILVDNLSSQLDNINDDRESDKHRYMAMGVDGELLLQESEFAYTSRKTKIERFKFHVNRRLDDVTKIIDTGDSGHITRDQTTANSDANFYRRAISKHRELLDEFELEATAIDRALWNTLDNKWLFEDINESNI